MDVTEFLALKKGYALAMLEQQGALGPANYRREPGVRRKGLPVGENADGWDRALQGDSGQYMRGKLVLPVGPEQAMGSGPGQIPLRRKDEGMQELLNAKNYNYNPDGVKKAFAGIDSVKEDVMQEIMRRRRRY